MCIKVMLKKPEIYIKAVIRSEINFWKAFGILIRRETNVSRPIKFVNIIQRSILILLQSLHNSTICILHKSAKKRKQAGQP